MPDYFEAAIKRHEDEFRRAYNTHAYRLWQVNPSCEDQFWAKVRQQATVILDSGQPIEDVEEFCDRIANEVLVESGHASRVN